MKNILIIIFIIYFQKSNGQNRIKYMYDNVGNRTNRSFITVRLENTENLEFTDSLKRNLEIFPNPTTQIINISFSNLNDGESVVMVLSDIQGKNLMNRKTLNKQNMIDLSAFKNGNYFLSIIINDKKTNYKISKVE